MKHIKLWENFNHEDNEQIEIRTGSHFRNKELNKEQFPILNSMLLSEENPEYDLFNTETLYLDDTDGLISIVKSSTHHDITEEQASRINDFIRTKLKDNGDGVWIYIDSYLFKK